MPTPQRWKDPGLGPYQERDAAQKLYKRYLRQRERRFFVPGDLVGDLRAFFWRRRWLRAQRPPAGKPKD
jgi:hypothetical protein